MAPRSLIGASRDKYINAIRSVQPQSRWKILVVDSYTKTLLNSVLKMYDILQENVSTVENIESQRPAQSTFEAAYLLCPTSQNVERIIRELAPEQGRPPQYAAGHLFFVDSLSNSLIQRLTSSPAEPKLRQLIELYTNFWPIESQVFSLKTPQSFLTLYQPLGGPYAPDPAEAIAAIDEELHFATQTLLNVCVSLNEFPLIRYYNPSHPPLGPLAISQSAQASPNAAAQMHHGSARMARLRGDPTGSNALANSGAGGEHFTKRLALRLQSAIDAYVKENEPKPETGRPRGVLFIADRTMDTVAPFLHEFSYQAMCNDLLPIMEGNKYKYSFTNSDGEREDKEAVLTDDDAVWQGIRHLHIVEAIDKLTRDFKSHAGEAGQFTDNASTLNDMRDMLANLPQMQEMKDKLSLHLTMAQSCMTKFEKTRLPAQAMVEQNCATRTTPEGQKPRTLVEEMVPLLDATDVSNADKVRVIALYIMYSDGVPDEDRRRLFQHARLSLAEMDAVNNLVHLGARVVKDPMNNGWDAWFKKGKRKQITGENEYELSRYQPLVKLMIEDHFAGKLETSTYPYVRDGPPEVVGGGASNLVSSAMRGRELPLNLINPGHSSTNGSRPQPSSLRSAKPTWHQKGRPGAGAGGGGSYYSAGGAGTGGASGGGGGGGGVGAERGDGHRQRVIVFVVGGMTFSEIRSTYQVSERLKRDVYIGSSHVFTPESFINNLKHIGKAGGGVRAWKGDSHGSGGDGVGHGLPSGASHLSAPVNEISKIRSLAAKARNSSQQSPLRGGKDDRSPTAAAAAAAAAAAPPPPSASSSNYDHELQAGQQVYDRRFNHAAAPPQQHTNGSCETHHHPENHHLSNHPGQHHQPHTQPHLTHSNNNRSASPAPSSASSAGRLREKKGLKNLFSSKK
ncbi:hypothetical protein CBS101457_002103 [Exobasidium rhododendri]|nr:hypothetical protein CBS101457_002103 [Exobasidium rhododendri]